MQKQTFNDVWWYVNIRVVHFVIDFKAQYTYLPIFYLPTYH
jgi:hypothetical protein